MRNMLVITLMGIAIVGGSALTAVAGEMKAKMEKAKGDMKADYEETKGEAKGLNEDVKGNKTKAELERAKGKMKGGGEREREDQGNESTSRGVTTRMSDLRFQSQIDYSLAQTLGG